MPNRLHTLLGVVLSLAPAVAFAAPKAVINERTLTMAGLATAAIVAFVVWLNVAARERR